MERKTIVSGVLTLVAIVLLGLLINNYNNKKDEEDIIDVEEFENNVIPSENNNNETPKEVDYPATNAPSKCFPRDRLSAKDLLPNNAANSQWAQAAPAGQGEVDGRNYLTSGKHLGINTTGSSLRNANQQLRSEPPNPQVQVSPWMQTTIGPDLNRRPLE